MLELSKDNEPMDLITVSDLLKSHGFLESVGGSSYLSSLVESTPTAANILSYVAMVKEASLKRELLGALHRAEEEIYEASDDSATIAGRLTAALIQLENSRPGGFVHIAQVMVDALKRIEAAHQNGSLVTGVPTGFHGFDTRMGGIQPGEVLLLAGRPGMGKSAIGADIATGGAEHGHGVCIITLEMENVRVGQRLLSTATGIENRNLRRGILGDKDFPVIVHQAGRISELSLWMFDSDHSWDRIQAKIRSLKLREPNLSLVVIDYVQLLSASVPSRERYLEVGRISSEVKRLALDLKIGIVLLSQLNREVESRSDKRPQLSDLRESGSLEQDADIVGLLYREAYYDREAVPHELTELNIAKNRDGMTGVIKLCFNERTVSFSDWVEET
jgi:replicative DNA helicase